MKLKICKNKDSILRSKSKQLLSITEDDIKLFDAMVKIMQEENGIGLAAPQVGILKQMIVADIGTGVLKLVNPCVIAAKGSLSGKEEKCLSLPGVKVLVKRFNQVVVEALDLKGKKIKLEAVDLMARVLQHEIDHLNGKLIVDYLPWYKRIFVRMKNTV
ncbi:MAG: peptide deformylase [Candidatus Omnitrophica bacterium]|nr:peptide deformylase [Candidatus Omnitrophota bacterium]